MQARHTWSFPLGTFTVNVAGSFVLGLIATGLGGAVALAALGTGFCGAVTTYSVVSIPAGLAAAALGWTLGRYLL